MSSNQFGYTDVGLKADLTSPHPQRQTSAIRYVIASMTIGKDMGAHFLDVAKLVGSPNLGVKKLAYLYLMQNAKSQPDKAVLQSGVFVRDTHHESPLIRGIALRTMTSMLVPAMVEFAHGPIVTCLRDLDPYVRRTAAVSALKLWYIAPMVADESGAIQLLVELLSDPVAAVVAAAACSICEMCGSPNSHRVPAVVNEALVSKTRTLVAALADSTEWPQTYLLEALAYTYTILKPTVQLLEEHEMLIGRVIPLLQSSNPAVVMNGVRCVVSFVQVFCSSTSPIPVAQQAETERRYFQQIAQPFISLVSTPRFELRFVALRNLQLLVNRYREAFIPYVSSLFLKYDDPIYIKTEKLELILCLTTAANGAVILAELVEYASEIDIDLVRKAVRAIGILAVREETLAAQCVLRLIRLIESRVNYVVQEAAVVVQTILRQYPNRFESVIEKLCAALDVLDDADSKAAVAWVVGEYADSVENTAEILGLFCDAFHDEATRVQLAVLTASVKAFLKIGEGPNGVVKQTLERVLGLCTTSPIPDVRDRGFFYWRLVLSDPDIARQVIMGPKDPLVDAAVMDKTLRTRLMSEAGCLSSVFHRPIQQLLGDPKKQQLVVLYEESDEDIDEAEEQKKVEENQRRMREVSKSNEADVKAVMDATFDDGPSAPAAPGSASSPSLAPAPAPVLPLKSAMDDVFGAGPSVVSASGAQLTPVLTNQEQGFSVAMAWVAAGALPELRVQFSLSPKSHLASVRLEMMQLNVSVYQLGLGQDFPSTDLKPGDSVVMRLRVNINNQARATTDVQIALKAPPLGVMFFSAPPVPLEVVLSPATAVEPAKYVEEFKQLAPVWALPAGQEVQTTKTLLSSNALRLRHLHLVHAKEAVGDHGQQLLGLHIYAITRNGVKLYVELTAENDLIVLLTVRTPEPVVAPVMGAYLLECLAKPPGS